MKEFINYCNNADGTFDHAFDVATSDNFRSNVIAAMYELLK